MEEGFTSHSSPDILESKLEGGSKVASHLLSKFVRSSLPPFLRSFFELFKTNLLLHSILCPPRVACVAIGPNVESEDSAIPMNGGIGRARAVQTSCMLPFIATLIRIISTQKQTFSNYVVDEQAHFLVVVQQIRRISRTTASVKLHLPQSVN